MQATGQRCGKPTLSVVMPVHNEDRTLRAIIEKVLSSTDLVEIELVVVDDGSSDQSRSIVVEMAAAHPNIRYHFLDRNRGKGAAVRKGIELASGHWILIQDADLEYDPADYPKMLRPALEGHADAVFGSRFAASEYRRVLYFWHSIANRLLTGLANVLNDLTLTDMETCYKLVRADILKRLALRGRSFTIEPEITTRLAQYGARIYEVPISYRGRTYAEGKSIGARDAIWAVWALLYYRFLNTRFTTDDGYRILRAMSQARGFNSMLMKRVRGHLGDRVLEAGCGIGNLTELLLRKKRLVAVDKDSHAAETVRWRFGHLANFRGEVLDLESAGDYRLLAGERLDTVLCMNVLEHIEKDVEVLRHFHEVLEPGGRAVCLVPQHRWLYSPADRSLGHLRRYSREELVGKVREAGFEVVSARSFNRLGTLGWWVNGRILRKRDLSPAQMRTYEMLMPLARTLEFLRLLPGLSLIVVGRKPADS